MSLLTTLLESKITPGDLNKAKKIAKEKNEPIMVVRKSGKIMFMSDEDFEDEGGNLLGVVMPSGKLEEDYDYIGEKYDVKKEGDGWVVFNKKTGESKNDTPHKTYAKAKKHLAALYANVPDAKNESVDGDDKKAYQTFFNKMMKKHGISDIGDLSDKEKKEFFNKVDKAWNSEGEAGKDGLTESVMGPKSFAKKTPSDMTDSELISFLKSPFVNRGIGKDVASDFKTKVEAEAKKRGLDWSTKKVKIKESKDTPEDVAADVISRMIKGKDMGVALKDVGHGYLTTKIKTSDIPDDLYMATEKDLVDNKKKYVKMFAKVISKHIKEESDPAMEAEKDRQEDEKERLKDRQESRTDRIKEILKRKQEREKKNANR